MEQITLKPKHIKTRRGTILKIVRENYLRNDIKSGLENKRLSKKSCLASLSNQLGVCLDPCLLVIDTNICLHQIDILESTVVKNVVVPQTVLKEVKGDMARVITLSGKMKNILI